MKDHVRMDLYGKVILEFPPARERMNCRFLGVAPDEFVALRVPVTPGIKERLADGAIIDIRYLHEGSIMSFRSDVIIYQAAPFSILFLRYPTGIEKHDLRKEERVACRMRTIVSKSEKTWKGVTVDISESGCQFLLEISAQEPPAVEKGDVVTGMYLPIGGEELTFKARVASTGEREGRYSIGLEFEDADAFPPQEFYDSMKELSQMLGD